MRRRNSERVNHSKAYRVESDSGIAAVLGAIVGEDREHKMLTALRGGVP